MDDDATIGRRAFLAGAGSAAAAALSGCIGGVGDVGETVSETVTETYDAAGIETVELSSPTGEITVEGTDRDTVGLTADKKANGQDLLDAATVTSTRDGSRLEISVEVDDGATGLFETPPQVDLDVEMPPSLRLARAKTVNGIVRVTDVKGPLEVEAVNGDIEVSDVDGGVTVDVTNGEITVEDVTGGVVTEATNGDVTVSNVRGDVNVDTVNGDIAVSTVTGDATVDTINGDLSISDVGGEVNT